MKYTSELHERVRQNLRMFDYPRFDDGDIDALLDEIEHLNAELARLTAELAELRERISKAREAFYANFDAANAAITMIDILNDAEIPEPPEATDVDN